VKKGLFSFLIVLGFLPLIFYGLQEHSQAVEWVNEEKQSLTEQQVLTNKENEFQHSFWASSVACVKQKKRLKYCLSSWEQLMEKQGINVFVGEWASSKPREKNTVFSSMVRASPDGKSVEVKSKNPWGVLGAFLRAGKSSSWFLIPSGCSRGV
jgi:hypothetical protein